MKRGLNGTPKGVPFQNTGSSQLFPEPVNAASVQGSSEVHGLSLVNFPALPLALQRRLLRRFAEGADLALDFDHVERLLRCARGELVGAELPGGWLAARKGGCLELRAPQPGQVCAGYEYRLPVPGEVLIPEIGVTIRAVAVKREFAGEAEPGTLLSADLLGSELLVRNWKPGDRFWPINSGSEEKLKRLFAERHISAQHRPAWPVVFSGAEIVWVRGFPVARAFAWAGSGDAVKIEMLAGLST